MTASNRSKITTALLVVAAIGVGRMLAPGSPAPSPSPAVVTRDPVVVRVPASATTSSDFDRAAFREELKAALAEMGVPPAAATAAPIEPTAEQHAAAGRSTTLVAEAIARKRWTLADSERFQEVLGAMTSDQRLAAVSSVTAAINRGELVPEHPMLF